MRVLIACECSQVECKAFREKGYEAYSCDIQDCYGGHSEWHIKRDCFEVLQDSHWDLVIAHPPCTYLSICQGNLIFRRGGEVFNFPRWRKSLRAARFFRRFLSYYERTGVPVAVENPSIFYSRVGLPKPDYRCDPSEFGEIWHKPLNFWLRGLPYLLPEGSYCVNPKSWHYESALLCHDWNDRQTVSNFRSRSFVGVAKAMANQWGDFVAEKLKRGGAGGVR